MKEEKPDCCIGASRVAKKHTSLKMATFKPMVIKRFKLISLGVALLLTIPLVAMLFSTEVHWTVGDFIVMAVLLFITGIGADLAYRTGKTPITKGILIAGAIFLLMLVWSTLAVGFPF